MKDKIFCPVCMKNKLILRQINLNCAVYLCRDKQCSYPLGHNWKFQSRTLEEMYRDKKKRVKKKPTKPHHDKSPSAVNDEQAFNINDLIEDEINKIQNSAECADPFDINTDFLDGDNFASLFQSKDDGQFVYNSVECFNSSNLANDSYIEKVLHNESAVSNTEVYADAIGFCDNFNSSVLSELLDNDTEVVTEMSSYLENSVNQNVAKIKADNARTEVVNEISNCYLENCGPDVEKSSPKKMAKNVCFIGGNDDEMSDVIGKLINSSQNRNKCTDKSLSKSSKPIILNHYIFNKQY